MNSPPSTSAYIQSQISTPIASTNRCKLSEWGLPPLIIAWFRNKGVTSLFEWQVECLCKGKVLFGENLVYSAPTSAGKTLIADFLVLKCIFERQKKALVIEPFIALAREKALTLKSMLWTTKAKVGAFCGTHYTPGGLAAVGVAICTIEKANNIINRLINEDRLRELGIIVVDEIHYLGDPSRGYLLELLLTKVIYYNNLQSLSNKIQIVGLSATIPNLKCVADWLNASLFVTNYRPVPLKEKIKIENNIYDAYQYLVEGHKAAPLHVIDHSRIVLRKDIDDICYICIDSIIEGHSALVFCESRRDCEIMASTLAEQIRYAGQKLESSNEQEKLVSLALRKHLSSRKIIDLIAKLKACPAGLDDELGTPLKFGVAFHHAGLTNEERDIVEDGFKSGAIKTLMATSTLSSGVNLPARRVIIKSPEFYGNKKKEMLEPMIYKQMVGRAGRKNIDTYGESILISRSETKDMALELVSRSLNDIKSSLGMRMIAYNDDGNCDFNEPSSGLKKAILEVIANNTAKTRQQLDLYLKSSFWLSSSPVSDQKNFMRLVAKTLHYLVLNKFIEELDKGVYRSTRFGTAVLTSGLAPDESLELLNDLLRAREGFCLVNDLHIIYQITPNDIARSIEIRDWVNFLNIWTGLDEISQYVGKRIGIDETVIAKRTRGFMNALTSNEERVYRRFMIALAINDLVSEMSLTKICIKYKLPRATIQQAQRATAQFAGVLSIFCEQLGFDNIAALVTPLESRINFSCQRDLLELIRLNISRPVARSLFNSGFKTILSLAKCETLEIDFAIRQAKPFKKDSSFHESDLTSPMIWVPELAKSMLVIEYAQHIIETARSHIEVEFDIDLTQNPIKRKETSLSQAIQSKTELNGEKRVKTVDMQNVPEQGLTMQDFRKDNRVSPYEDEILTIGAMPQPKDIPNFEVKYIESVKELEDFLDFWKHSRSISVNFKVESDTANNPIGEQIFAREKAKRRQRRYRQQSEQQLFKDDSCTERASRSDLDSSSSEENHDSESGLALQLDIDNQKHTITRLYTCFNDEYVVYVIRSVKGLTYLQQNFYKYINAIEEETPKLYTQNIVFTYKVMYAGFGLNHVMLNRCFEWHSFEVAWWMVNNCPLRGKCNSNSSLSRVARTEWVPQFRHFLYPSSPKTRISGSRSRRDFLRLKDVVKSGKTAILQPLIDDILIELAKRKQLDAYRCAEIPSRLMMANMMVHGIGVGTRILSQELRLYEELLQQLTDITRECYAKTNKTASLTNIRHVAQILYDDLDLKQYLHDHTTNSDISKDPTNAEILKILIKYHPFPKVVQDYRKISKASEALQSVSTHARYDNELDMMRVCGNCDFWQLTGRVSMWDPDMFLINRNFSITIPAHQHRQEESIDCAPRGSFIPFKQWEFVSADYSQLELRLLAHFSGDENLLAILNQVPDGNMTYDVFRTVASKIYKIPVGDVTTDKRQHAKQICYGLIYGMGDKSLGIQLGVNTEQAREFRDDFLSAFPKIKEFTRDLLKDCQLSGYVESYLGRRRNIEFINSDKSQLRARAERVAINTKIQSSASDVIKLAMEAVNKLIIDKFYQEARMVLEMHDELIFEIQPQKTRLFAKALKSTMEDLHLLETLKVNLLVNLKKGSNWSDLHTYEI